ncbi:hypothetical protein NMK71_06190 [Weeksellaceae bacterium KMM 9713]|uniref:Uncharacterized protein n=1 Tax=Profundicola chukchiensis TaxID=2961959 RepID=A0A9X4MYM7_9FLAO|nr:hypothetical protein [Profundicola chukchiensis]MDG4945997.1 hypothetical protein [Profundicola chukchiensis]
MNLKLFKIQKIFLCCLGIFLLSGTQLSFGQCDPDNHVWFNDGSSGEYGYFDVGTAEQPINPAQKVIVGETNTFTQFGDIGFNIDGRLYGVSYSNGPSTLYLINGNTIELIQNSNIDNPGFRGNSLSFLPDGTGLRGVGNTSASQYSKVYRFKIEYDDNGTASYTHTLWKDFSQGALQQQFNGRPAGDFVYLNGKIYSSWEKKSNGSFNGDYRLLVITVNPSTYDYESHVELGKIKHYSKGLAGLNGELYSIGDYVAERSNKISGLFKLNISNPPINNTGFIDQEVIHSSTDADINYFGATSKQEVFGGECPSCTQEPTLGEVEGNTKIGISTMNRDVADTSWAEGVQNGFIKLDSKSLGFVPTRLTSNQRDNLNAEEGMMIWNITNQCLEFYNGTKWVCGQNKCNTN